MRLIRRFITRFHRKPRKVGLMQFLPADHRPYAPAPLLSDEQHAEFIRYLTKRYGTHGWYDQGGVGKPIQVDALNELPPL
jgi:hypothetical protein